MLGSCLSFLEESRLKYESKGFEQLKAKTGEFLEHGALGNIRVYCEMTWPYRRKAENYLDELAKADVRKALIASLYHMCRGKGIETTRATERSGSYGISVGRIRRRNGICCRRLCGTPACL